MDSKKITLTIPGEVSKGDLGALVCDGVMLAILLWNQIRYEMNMLFLIIPLFLVGLYLSASAFFPESYCFTETQLQITHAFRRKICIPYEAVFHYDASARDSFVNILQSNWVKVYYFDGTKKKMLLCRPRDAAGFAEALRSNCPEFYNEEKSKLDVFFDKHEQN